MFKKAYIKTALVALLLTTLIFSLGILVRAEDTTFHVSVNFVDDGCKRITLSYTDTAGNPQTQSHDLSEDGKTFSADVPLYANNITLTLELYPGYALDEAMDSKETPCFKSRSEEGLVHKIDTNLVDTVIRVSTKYETYNITYQYPDGMKFESAPPETHTFNTDTVIYNPTREGYTFEGWLIRPEEGSELSLGTLSPDPTMPNCVKLLGTNRPNDGTTFYLEPIWRSATTLPLYCVDIDLSKFVDPDDYTKCTILEGGTKYKVGDYALGQTINVKDLPAKVYTGYYFYVNPDKPTANRGEITIANRGEAENLIYRCYLPYEYDLQYSCSINGEALTFPEGTTLPETHTFNEDTEIPTPSLTDHIFVGWSAEVYDAKTETWKKVTLSKVEEGGVIVNSYMNSNTLHSDAYGDTRVIRLIANWTLRPFNVEIQDETGAPLNATVTVNGTVYTGGTVGLTVGDTVKIVITVEDGYKLVQWMGADDEALTEIDHKKVFEYEFVMPQRDFVLVGATAPTASAPTFVIDYTKEILTTDTGTIPDGSYVILSGDSKMELTVVDGKITIYEDGESRTASTVPIWSGAFGSEIKIIVRGDGTTTADSDALGLPAVARPEKPTKSDLTVTEYRETAIIIQMTPPVDLSLYEFACIESDDVSKVTRWYRVGDPELIVVHDDAVKFEGLKPGTPYYAFVRMRATDASPHGFEYRIPCATKSHDTIEAAKDELWDLVQDTDGDMVDRLIQNAVDQLSDLQNKDAYANFQSDLNAILAYVDAQIGLARLQDELVAKLNVLRDSLLQSQTLIFSSAGSATINSFHASAREAIQAATTPEGARAAYNLGESNIRGVDIKTVISGTLTLSSDVGIKQSLLLLHSQISDLSSLNSLVRSAAKNRLVEANNGFLSKDQAVKSLRSLSLLAAYNMELSTGSATYTIFDGEYTVRVLLQDELLDNSGLQAAYYSEREGKLILLETKRVGNELVFTANSVENFLILGDPSVDLTLPLIILGIILLFQWLSIAILLVWRKKSASAARLHCTALLPVLLTVRFTPMYSFTWLLVLAALVILSQGFLIYLILTSNIRRRGAAPKTTVREDADSLSVAAMLDGDDEAVEASPEPTDADEENGGASENDPFAYGETVSYEEDDLAIRTEETTEFSLENEDAAEEDSEQSFYDDVSGEEVPEEGYESGENTEEALTWVYEDEDSVVPLDGYGDASYWSMDPETGEVFEEASEEPLAEFAEEQEVASDEASEELADDEEDGAEEEGTEEETLPYDEIYVEPDVTGEEAPAPESYYADDSDE